MMDVERSSLCNCVVNFLLEENYLLTAFELLHELLDDGRDAHAIRLKEFFSDPSHFPADQISRYNSIRVVDPQSLLAEKEAIEEKLALSDYELRLAQEDIIKLKTELQRKADLPQDKLSESSGSNSINHALEIHRQKRDAPFSDLGPLKANERKDLNCAVKEYLLIAGYRLTAMTFYEEVTDQKLDVWENSPASVPDALRHYYYQYLSSTSEAAEEKISMIRENDSLKKANESLNHEKECLMKNKNLAEGQMNALTKSLEAAQKDLKDKDKLIQDLKHACEHQRQELNDCRAEITSLKMHIEGSHSVQNSVATNVDSTQSQAFKSYKEEIKSLQVEIERLKAEKTHISDLVDSSFGEKESIQTEEKVVEMDENKTLISHPIEAAEVVDSNTPLMPLQTFETSTHKPEENLPESVMNTSSSTDCFPDAGILSQQDEKLPSEDGGLHLKSENLGCGPAPDNTGLGTIQILADALPKIVPYVLINHREELLPLIMCAIERHPDNSTRDSLTHTLFNLIKRPDEQQRRIIMDACVTLAKNVGEMRTETELLPQCWEQINHMYEERRLLVAQSCGELAEFVQPEIRDSLILSIVQQLIEDPATVVREAAAHNLALLLPLFPLMDKYFKVEELMFQLACDPSGVVVETTLKELLPAIINWGNKLDNILRVLLSHILGSAQRCPPLSGVEGSLESHLRVLGERERWNLDVLLRMLAELLPYVHQKAIETCPFSSVSESNGTIFSTSILELYAGGHVEWPAFEWMHVDCLSGLLQLAWLLPQKEDSLRNRTTKFLLAVSECFGDSYLTHIMLPVFLVAVGDDADLMFFPPNIHSRIKGLRPRTAVAERLAILGILPLLLAGVLGSPGKREQLADYLRKLLVEGAMKENQSTTHNIDIVNAVRFLCTFEEHHGMIFNILWEMVVSSNIEMKISAANILKVIVPYIGAKVASTHVLPALITLGSDQNLNVKYASIDAFGAVAQHFKNDMIVDKIRVQMDAFLEDGSHEATIAVVRSLVVAVPHTTERLRDYLLSKIFQLTSTPVSATDVMHRRQRANVFCEAIRAVDATDLSANSIRDFLLPTIQNMFKDPDALDPAHKEALEIILKERSGGTFEALSKVMGAHLGIASSVTSFFGEGGLLGKKEITESPTEPVESPKAAAAPAPAEDTRFMRIMRVTDMLRGKAKNQEETHQTQ
ncbi:lisH domain and HEAT repeat-containing protein KIAA1468-like [Durio zibethinus]|uniref:LisH domain and HEAT repeat-containing protein KIAA1468-like n=1 Tax=Durio zibethinus TaxID=66656 RepID=A0A6P6A2Q9_DURZI|nr:lisH domain and HEAT repeat-containing protein KIAA1468-like [Durio zibethinus]